MFIVYHSNRLEVLADQLAALARQPTDSRFAPEIILVQSLGLARWLSLRLADQLGICANVCYQFPAAFIWDLFHRVLPNVPETSPFATDVLTWRFMALLSDVEEGPRFAPLCAYCADGDDVKRHALASRLATVYDQYLVHRPEWIRAWEAGPDDHWQAELWRRLIAANGTHRVHVHEQFLHAVDTQTLARATLPERVSLIGMPAMPPLYLDLLSRLAASIDLHLFLLNPCQEYWGDIVAERNLARRPPVDDPTALHFKTGNPLLASMGKLGRDFIDLVQDYPHHLVEQYADPGSDSLLHCLQADVLHLRNRGPSACPATPLHSDDRSVQVHICHSRMREIEALYDQLLGLFETHPELQPSDVVVMAPEIDAYAPLIEAWIRTLLRLIEDFFAPDETEEQDLQAIRQTLAQIGQDAAQAGFDEPVSLEVLMSWSVGGSAARRMAWEVSDGWHHLLHLRAHAQHPLRDGLPDRHARRGLSTATSSPELPSHGTGLPPQRPLAAPR